MVARQVDIRPLKEFGLCKLSKEDPLRGLLLSDRDLLDPSEFLVKTEMWLRLLRMVHSRALAET